MSLCQAFSQVNFNCICLNCVFPLCLWVCLWLHRSKRSACAERGDLEHCAHDKEQQDHRPHKDPKDLQGEICCQGTFCYRWVRQLLRSPPAGETLKTRKIFLFNHISVCFLKSVTGDNILLNPVLPPHDISLYFRVYMLLCHLKQLVAAYFETHAVYFLTYLHTNHVYKGINNHVVTDVLWKHIR